MHIQTHTVSIIAILLINESSAVAEIGDRLARIDIGRKEAGAAVPLSVGELDPL